MNDDGERPPSIRRRLMVFLIGSLLLMIAGAAVVTYSVAWRSANDAYDRSLLDPAFDIADNVSVDAHGAHVDLPQKALEALVFDQTDKVIYQVRTPGDAIIDGVADLPPPPPFAPDQFNFFDTTYRGEKIRVAALRAPNGIVVQIGETLHKRTRLVGEILVAELVPATLIAVASIALASPAAWSRSSICAPSC
jgi:two-component system sensor histidine kinase TctE